MSNDGFDGLRVLTLESRRSQEMAKLISNCRGQPVVAPSMREVPLQSNTAAIAFAAMLLEGQFDMAIFLTGVGTRALTRVIETTYSREEFVAALSRLTVVARGPKPAAVLRELGVPISLLVPEPNTWRELLRLLDEHAGDKSRNQSPNHAHREAGSFNLSGLRVALQEYGEANPELVAGLKERGASVTCVPVYEWMLPEDTSPLRAAVTALTQGEIDVALFTSSVQVRHLLQIAAEMGVSDKVLRAFGRVLVASIGPITTEQLSREGITADLEPSHPKMGLLVSETADRSAALLPVKRNRIPA